MTVPAVFSSAYVVPTPAQNMTKLQMLVDQLRPQDRLTFHEPDPVTRDMLYRLHDQRYVDAMLEGVSPLCRTNNLPWSSELVRAVCMMNGGMITATRLAEHYGVCINLANGFHHAGYARGQAYCTFNGLALVAKAFSDRTVFVLDADQHGGNGTEEFTAHIKNLTAFSIHGSPFGCLGGPRSILRTLRGLTDDPSPLWRALDDAFRAAEHTDVLVYQAGVDCHADDPHGSMGLTDAQLRERDRRVFRWARQQQIPLVVTLAGGYQKLERVVGLHANTVEELIDAFTC